LETTRAPLPSLDEQKTVRLIRDQLSSLGYQENSGIRVEEQRSGNPDIDKRLKGASTTGKGAKASPNS